MMIWTIIDVPEHLQPLDKGTDGGRMNDEFPCEDSSSADNIKLW